ncbi:putative membrane protein, TIGR04086 family [Caloramator fervidus]|uniref:Putative membrane protein, TIGR04086 family n=1 Tax=Caloramator fervidus TaxID=29344 RepID=A0A1H5W0H1_9CLOT|nr:TIGR04086 family membrane protein [Caloramator fervidus]SEF92726.1 putative membrane protein, TIGR04086 family [Caloramator fervidus]
MSKMDKQKLQNFMLVYAKAILRGVILALVLILILTAVAYFAQINESYYKTITWIITIVSICYAAIYGALKIGKRGFLHGAIIGALFILVMFLAAYLVDKGTVNFRSYIILFITSLIIGVLSGMIGMVLKGNE